jgi:transitional endoplasmic reticulum ATPase
MRPGRLDQLIYIPLPDEPARLSILQAALRKSPIAPDVDLSFLAKSTAGFSGADLAGIAQRAVKLAIKDSIAADIQAEKARAARQAEAGADEEMAAEDEVEDTVPAITKAHFEEAFRYARRSVSDAELRRYEQFAAQLQANKGAGNQFKFPDATSGTEGAPAAGFQNDADDDDLYA